MFARPKKHIVVDIPVPINKLINMINKTILKSLCLCAGLLMAGLFSATASSVKSARRQVI